MYTTYLFIDHKTVLKIAMFINIEIEKNLTNKNVISFSFEQDQFFFLLVQDADDQEGVTF